MHDFQYVTKKTAAPVKEELLQLVHEVQDERIFRSDMPSQEAQAAI